MPALATVVSWRYRSKLRVGLIAMVSAGQILRSERKKQGLDLYSVAEQTKISERILEAIEDDRIDQIPSAFLYRSFVRQFASVLSIDFKQIAESVNAAVGEFPTVRVPGENYHPTGLAPIRPRREGISAWASRVFSLLAVIVICSGLYAYLSRIETPDFTGWRAVAVGESNHTGQALSSLWSGLKANLRFAEKGANAGQSPLASLLESPGTAAGKGGDEPILLRIAAVEKTWLSIESDGRHVFSGLLEPSDTKVLEGHASARIRTGNAGGLRVMFNGRQLGRLGQSGQVRTVLFTSDDQYEILQPSLTSRLQLFPAVAFSRWTK